MQSLMLTNVAQQRQSSDTPEVPCTRLCLLTNTECQTARTAAMPWPDQSGWLLGHGFKPASLCKDLQMRKDGCGVQGPGFGRVCQSHRLGGFAVLCLPAGSSMYAVLRCNMTLYRLACSRLETLHSFKHKQLLPDTLTPVLSTHRQCMQSYRGHGLRACKMRRCNVPRQKSLSP